MVGRKLDISIILSSVHRLVCMLTIVCSCIHKKNLFIHGYKHRQHSRNNNKVLRLFERTACKCSTSREYWISAAIWQRNNGFAFTRFKLLESFRLCTHQVDCFKLKMKWTIQIIYRSLHQIYPLKGSDIKIKNSIVLAVLRNKYAES